MTGPRPFPHQLVGVPMDRLLDAFGQAAARLRLVTSGLTAEVLTTRPRGLATWSIGGIVAHLADSEVLGAVRIRTAIVHSGSALVEYDQDRFAERLGYERRTEDDMRASLNMFQALREATSRVLGNLGEPDWQGYGTHSEWGRLTVRQLLELYADHGERHLDQILDIRMRLGNPVALPSVLSARLDTRAAASVG